MVNRFFGRPLASLRMTEVVIHEVTLHALRILMQMLLNQIWLNKLTLTPFSVRYVHIDIRGEDFGYFCRWDDREVMVYYCMRYFVGQHRVRNSIFGGK